MARVDIVELIGQYVALTQAGREWKGRCPFHEETAASFHVNPEKGLYHCFGCKEGGNVISFVMKVENLEFREAMEWLANRYNIEIPRTEGQQRRHGGKERLYELNEAALKFFRKSLQAPAGETAATYLSGRGISDRLISDFDLGYAPREWEALTDLLLSRGAKPSELVTLGLIKERRGDGPVSMGGESRGHYDSFRHRLIFPIRGVTGRVIGFAGRVLSDEDKPKYLNVTNTPLYDKSKVLYNLDHAKGVIRDEGVVVVEGYMDVIGLAGAGVTNTVATCGTALTSQHVTLLKRYTDRFFLAFDGDLAGSRAAWSAGTLFLKAGLDVRVIALPDGVDPDDLVRENGREAWLGLLSEAVSVVQFWLSHQRREHPDPDLAQQRKWVQQLTPLYQSVPDELVRQQFIRETASALRIGAAEVAGLLSGLAPGGLAGVKVRRTRKLQKDRRPGSFLVPDLYQREGNLVERLIAGQQLDQAHQATVMRRQSLVRGALAIEREVMRRLLDDDGFRLVYLALAEEEPVAEWFNDPQLREMFLVLVAETEPEWLLHDEVYSSLCSELLVHEPFLDDDETLMRRHRNEHFKQRVAEVSTQIREAIAAGDVELQTRLFTQLNQLKHEVKALPEQF